MHRVGDDIRRVVSEMGGDSEEARINMRVRQVLRRYRQALESIYPLETARLHLEHTNSVIITDVQNVRTLIVYVDDSLFAAELNAQRELIKLRLLELFGEGIEDFQIKTSRWKKYRDKHPYIDADSEKADEKSPLVPLDDSEKSFVSHTVAVVEDERIRKTLEKAMTADMEWKKGENMEKKVKGSL